MKKTYQIISATVPANSSKLFTEQLKSEYTNCTGIFIVKVSGNIEDLTVGMNIANQEVLPKETDASILLFNGQYSVKQATYDFSADRLPAQSNTTELTVTNKNAQPATVNVYYVLENF